MLAKRRMAIVLLYYNKHIFILCIDRRQLIRLSQMFKVLPNEDKLMTLCE